VPDATVYPWDYLHIDHIFLQRRIVPDDCVGIHWFGGDGESQKWNSLLSEANYRNYDSTFASYARQVAAP